MYNRQIGLLVVGGLNHTVWVQIPALHSVAVSFGQVIQTSLCFSLLMYKVKIAISPTS